MGIGVNSLESQQILESPKLQKDQKFHLFETNLDKEKSLLQIKDLNLMAQTIAREADKKAHNRTGEEKGGKIDDITVVVS